MNDLKTLESNISEVTVYSDRAQVTRTSIVNLEKGIHNLLFDMLPMEIDEKSIQVNGTGNAILKDVQFKKVYFSKIPNSEVKKTHDKMQELKDKKRIIEDKITLSNKEKKFLENINLKLTTPTEKGTDSRLTPDDWIKMVNFYDTKYSELNNTIYNSEISLRDIDNEIYKIKQEIKNMSTAKEKKQVIIIIESLEDDNIKIDLSYTILGPSWEPSYDIRVSSQEKKLNITYNGLIKQSTSENWDNVNIKLSTAQPQISGDELKLTPWKVNLLSDMNVSFGGTLSTAAAPGKMKMQSMRCANIDKSEAFEKAEYKKIEIPKANVKTFSSSVLFETPGKKTIKNNNENHKVSIMINEFPVEFKYSTTPKLSEYAYLKGKAKNTTDYPFLPGKTNIFFDNNFVANSSIRLISPGEEFWTSLGVDQSIKIEYKDLRKLNSKDGIFNKQKKHTYEYFIIITNKKSTEETISIYDQLPIPQNDKIKIQLISPVYKDNNESFTKNEYNYLKWTYKIKPNEKIKIDFRFSIEYPSTETISGL